MADERRPKEDDQIDPRPMSGIDPVVRMRAFLQGDIVLADLYELTKDELYEISEQAKILYEGGKFEESKRMFESLTALDPYDAIFHTGLGVAHQRLGELDAARLEYDRAISLNSRDLAARCNRAEIFIERAQYERAAKDLAKIFKYDPNGESGYTQRARGLAIAVDSVLKDLLAGANPDELESGDEEDEA